MNSDSMYFLKVKCIRFFNPVHNLFNIYKGINMLIFVHECQKMSTLV